MQIGRLIRRATLQSAVLVVALGMGFCERDMTVTVTNDGNPPTFKLDGSGRLIFFTVFERRTPFSADDPKMWEIRPIEENLISRLPEITYGIVPPGFLQTIPATGAPPPLVEGKPYAAGGPAFDANGGGIDFEIRNGKIVVLASDR